MVEKRAGLKRTARDLADLCGTAFSLLVPPLCLVCSAGLRSWERWVCRRCGLLISMSARPRARAIRLGNGMTLATRYGVEYTPAVSSVIREMKYGGKPAVAEFLAEFLWIAATDRAIEPAVLVPVPIHPARKRERGYNQAEALSRHLAAFAGLSIAAGALAKRRDTPSQTALEGNAREANVVGSIEARDVSELRDRPVVLVDDVVTTGSTLRECANALNSEGIEDISACAVASSL